jgi:hypothetical protein
LDESVHEMNELVESDEELYSGDVDCDGKLFGEESEGTQEEGESSDERSLIDSDEERAILKKRKEKDAKINNSFTGPYPVDPTDFNHTDKGPNY